LGAPESTFDLNGWLCRMDSVYQKPIWVLLLPLALFVALYFACRKENGAIDVVELYRLAVCASLTNLMWVLVRSFGGRDAARIRADLSCTASVACAWALAVTPWRVIVKKPVAAIVLTILTTLSLGYWGVFWAEKF